MFRGPASRTVLHITLAVGILLGATACSDDDDPVAPADTDLAVPRTYTFESRFNEGTSSVSYTGQTVRNLLLQDLKIFIDRLGSEGATGPIALDDLLQFYEYEDALNLQSLTSVNGKTMLKTSYSEIATGKNLVGKISPATVIGTDKTADELIREWFNIIVENSADPSKLGTAAVYTTEEGLDLTQMINKTLLGAVIYYQATSAYLSGVTDRDNSGPRADANYSAMEHAWDEAFGYFGAARNYSDYTDDQLAGGSADYSRDVNEDSRIDFESEYNFGFSRNAGKRDAGGQGTDFTKEIFDAFRTGRTHIVNEKSATEINVQAQKAAESWEKVIAATVVHYINDSIADMADLGTPDENIENLNKHWAEMKGFTNALQYSPFKRIADSDLLLLHQAYGEAPEYDVDGGGVLSATARLEQAKDILQATYGFSSANMEQW